MKPIESQQDNYQETAKPSPDLASYPAIYLPTKISNKAQEKQNYGEPNTNNTTTTTTTTTNTNTNSTDNTNTNNTCLEADLEEINHLIAQDLSHQEITLDLSQSSNSHILRPPDTSYSQSQTQEQLLEEEKHMAPIDCSGVSRAAGLKWFCKICSVVHRDKEDCVAYQPFHHPFTILPNTSEGRGLPHCLQITQRGVRCKVPVKAFTRFGPLVGRIIKEEEMDFDEDRKKVFIIYTNEGSRKLVVASIPEESNWIREVRSASSSQSATALAISSQVSFLSYSKSHHDYYIPPPFTITTPPCSIIFQDQLYLVTTMDLDSGAELTFYSREDPTTEFWTSWTEAWCNQVRCARCAIQFDSIADYRVHITVWHDTSFQGNPQNRIYFCPDCGVKRIGAKDIVNHCKEEHRDLAFPCRHCGRRFESYNSLIKHKKRLHAVIKTQYRCEECSKTYSDAKALKAHIESIHKRSAELHCNQCERIFSSKYALNRHKNEVHKKIVQHTCEQCGKSFAQFSNMKIHMRTHTGVKPFQCRHNPALCRVAFTTKQCLQVHYRKVHSYTDLTMPAIAAPALKEGPVTTGDRSERVAAVPEDISENVVDDVQEVDQTRGWANQL